MTPQQEIADIKRRLDEMERATRFYPPHYPPGYKPPPTAPYPHPPWRDTTDPWWEYQPTIVYCQVAH